MNVIPKFSIIIPVYNVQDYLSKCLDSIIEQTLLDIEIICVNDGSKDRSLDILQQYSNKDARIKIVSKDNGGLSSARNIGLKLAKGAYICFLDSDDYVQPNFCERIYTEVLEHEPDIIVFGANIFPRRTDIEPWIYNSLSPVTKQFHRFKPDILLDTNRAFPFVWRNCFKRSYLEKNKLTFNEQILFGEDTIFQICAYPGAKNIICISDKLYNYRYDRKNSLMFNSRRDDAKRIHDHLNILKVIASYWKKAGYLLKWNDLFVAFSLDFIGYDLLNYKSSDKKELVRKYFSLLRHYGIIIQKPKLPWQYRELYRKLRFYAKKDKRVFIYNYEI